MTVNVTAHLTPSGAAALRQTLKLVNTPPQYPFIDTANGGPYTAPRPAPLRRQNGPRRILGL